MAADVTGTFIRYTAKRFTADAMERLRQANIIILEYEEAGYSLTLRGLHYQLVSRGLQANTMAEYTRLGNLISDGRLAGLVSWTAIEDIGRNLMGVPTQDNPGDGIVNLALTYRRDLWAGQDWRPEVWVEKQALEGVVGRICRKLRVDYFATKGYNSQSEAWRAGRRLAGYIQKGQRPIIFHLGDHDPSGLDMTRDNQERVSLFAGTQVQVVRLALNWPQIEEHKPPPNPAKMTDSRAADYVARYGDESWELDALAPQVIHRLIEQAVHRLRDQTKWDAALAQEANDREMLRAAAEDMGAVVPEIEQEE